MLVQNLSGIMAKTINKEVKYSSVEVNSKNNNLLNKTLTHKLLLINVAGVEINHHVNGNNL